MNIALNRVTERWAYSEHIHERLDRTWPVYYVRAYHDLKLKVTEGAKLCSGLSEDWECFTVARLGGLDPVKFGREEPAAGILRLAVPLVNGNEIHHEVLIV